MASNERKSEIDFKQVYELELDASCEKIRINRYHIKFNRLYERPHPDFGKVIEIVVPDKWGARFTIEGEMIGFLEP